MSKHLAVYVKNEDLQEFITKLDSKGWSVIDVEPTTRINNFSLVAAGLGLVDLGLFYFNVISCKLSVAVGIILAICYLATISMSTVTKYTVICEYTGNEELIDMTPFDDTDDNFIKNDDYKEVETGTNTEDTK